MRFWLLVICVSRLASAEPARSSEAAGAVAELSAPAPLLMPELVPRTRLVISPMASTGLVINLLQLGVGGTVAVGNFEVFGDVRARLAGVVQFGGSNDSGGLALGNVRAGARYHLAAGNLRVAPSIWAWLPSSNASNENHADYAQMSGVDNWRAFGPDATALGLAVDAAWRDGPTFVQIEAGAAIVSDNGPQIDDVFAALGVGKQLNPRLSLLAEWRVEMFPSRERMHGPAIGFGRETDARSWRLRVHPYVFGDFEWGGVAVALDYIQRFP